VVAPGGGVRPAGLKRNAPATLSFTAKASSDPSVTVPPTLRTVPEYSKKYTGVAVATLRLPCTISREKNYYH
jgi:hypothetical protein